MSGTLKSANYRNVHTLGFVCWVSLDIMYLLSLNCNPDKTKRTAATSEDKVHESLISFYTFVYMRMPVMTKFFISQIPVHTTAVATWCNRWTRFSTLFISFVTTSKLVSTSCELLECSLPALNPNLSCFLLVFLLFLTPAMSQELVKEKKCFHGGMGKKWSRGSSGNVVQSGGKIFCVSVPCRPTPPVPLGVFCQSKKTARGRRTHLSVNFKNFGQSILDFRRRQ